MTILAKGVWVLLVVLVVILLVIPANKSVVAADNIVVTINTPTPTASIIIAPTLTASAFVNNAPILPPTDPKRSDWIVTQGCSEHIINEGSPCANDFAYYGNPGNADGSPLVAPFDCWVFENINHLSLNNGYGNNLVYCVGKYYTAIMTHLHGYYNNVDTFVKQGTPIAKMGGSDPTHDGYTTGLHVHTEIWQYCNNENPTTIAQAIARRCSEAVDPKIWINWHYGGKITPYAGEEDHQ